MPSAKPHLRKKTPHPSSFGCHLLPPEKAYLYPTCSCLLYRRRNNCTSAPRPVGVGAPDDPQRTLSRRPPVGHINFRSPPCLLLPEKGDRSAVDEECALSPVNLSSTISPPSFPPDFVIDQDAQATKKGCPRLSARATAFSYCLFLKYPFGSSQNSDASRRKSDGIRRATPTYKRSISGRKRSVARVEGAPFS